MSTCFVSATHSFFPWVDLLLIVLPQRALQSSKESGNFIYHYQAVISESETKVHVFPIPQLPPVDLTAVDSFNNLVSKVRNYVIFLHFVRIAPSNKPCPIALFISQGHGDGLRGSLE